LLTVASWTVSVRQLIKITSPAHEGEDNIVAGEAPVEETKIDQTTETEAPAAASESTAPEKDVSTAPAEEVSKEVDTKPAVESKEEDATLPVREKGMVTSLDLWPVLTVFRRGG
jgi:hypothetical protein